MGEGHSISDKQEPPFHLLVRFGVHDPLRLLLTTVDATNGNWQQRRRCFGGDNVTSRQLVYEVYRWFIVSKMGELVIRVARCWVLTLATCCGSTVGVINHAAEVVVNDHVRRGAIVISRTRMKYDLTPSAQRRSRRIRMYGS